MTHPEEEEIQDRPPQRRFTRRETPAVLASFPTLKRGQQCLMVRVLRYSKSDPLLDIREFVTSDEYSGFTRKGVALDYDQLKLLADNLEKIFEAMEA